MRYRSARPKPLNRFAAQSAASRLQALLHDRGYGHLRVRAHGQHLRVEAATGGGVYELVARAESLDAATYGLSFRTHAGRWEPLPVEGALEAIADGLTQELAAYLDPSNFMERT